MAYTETTSKSWFSRVGDSFSGICAALVLFVVGTGLLYWNEGRTVRTAGAIKEAQSVFVTMKDISKVDPAFEGKLIYATGRANSKTILEDPTFGIKTTGPALSLARTVEYYQWVESSKSEKRKKLGGGEETVTVYTYDKKWVSQPVDSRQFHDPQFRTSNTVITVVKPDTIWAPEINFGAYLVPAFLRGSIGGAEEINLQLSSEQLQKISMELHSERQTGRTQSGINQTGISQGMGGLQGIFSTMTSNVISQGGILYLTKSGRTDFPEIGDVHIRFFQLLPKDVSLIARVTGGTFEPFLAGNGTEFSRLSMGTVSAENMFGDAKSSNAMMGWLLRAAGAIIVMISISMLLNPLSVIADVIPVLGSIVGSAGGIVAFLLGLVWSMLVIAVAWIRFRPVLAFSLIGAAVVVLIVMAIKGHGHKNQPAPTA